MRAICGVMFLLTLTVPAAANGQSFELFGSAGPTLPDTGYSFALGAGLSPTPVLTIAGAFEQTRLSSRTVNRGTTGSSFRGGTLYLGTGELRYAPLGRQRVGPYGLAGFAAGVSQPTVNRMYTDRVTNGVRAVFFGGGIQGPLNEHVAFFADARLTFGAEGTEGIVATVPIRAGLAWRF